MYQSGISSRRANQRGWPLNISYMIHRVGWYGLMHTSNVVNNLTRSQTLLFVAKRLRRGLGNARISRIVVSQLIFSLLHSATVQGPKSYYCPTKRTYWLGIAERSIDNQESSPLGLIFTIIRVREQSYRESATQGKIALANEHSCQLSTDDVDFCTRSPPYQREVRASFGHPAREPLGKLLVSL